METALLNCTVEEVIQLLKIMLRKEGYEIEKIDLNRTHVLAYRDGKWYRNRQQVLFRISSLEDTCTRIDVTAVTEGKPVGETEEGIEEKIVSRIYQYMQ